MKQKSLSFLGILIVAPLIFFSGAVLAITWDPTVNTDDGTIENVNLTNLFADPTAQLVIFDADLDTFELEEIIALDLTGDSLDEVIISGPPPQDTITISFESTDSTYTATSIDGIDTLFLGDTTDFELALLTTNTDGSFDLSFVVDYVYMGSDIYFINFDSGAYADLLGVDLQPVPIPAAIWLFGSAMFGMVAVGRRKFMD